jgi:hypothetical protein
MRNTRIGSQRNPLPDRWQTRCRNTAVAPIPDHARLADRSWVFEYMALLDEEYRECRGHSSDRNAARHMRCCCGEDMDLRAFQLVGPAQELIAYRPFAVCPMCGWWVEF